MGTISFTPPLFSSLSPFLFHLHTFIFFTPYSFKTHVTCYSSNAVACVELSLTMYKSTTALISDAQPLLAAQVLHLQLITGYVLLLTKSLTVN
jgi:hypothetical protein